MRIIKAMLLSVIVILAFSLSVSADSGYIVRLNSERPSFVSVTNEEKARAMVDSGDALYYEENFSVTLPEMTEESAISLFAWKSSYGALDMSEFTSLGADGSGVTVAVIDSGVAYNIAELDKVVIGGKNFIDSTQDYIDNYGHGTYVSGIIASKSYGNARGAKIYAYKCFESGTIDDFTIIANAITDAADNDACQIINMSFGTRNSIALKDSINYAIKKGKIIVAAAGNYGSSYHLYPASYAGVISVASVAQDGTVSSFSQKNSGVDIAAQGEDIYVPTKSGGYGIGDGTSFSCPEIAAVIACMLELDPTLDYDSIYSMLTSTATDAGDTGKDNSYGYGIVNVSAIAALMRDKAILFGDVDGDKELTPADEILLSRSLAGLSGYTFGYIKAADTNFDGNISVADHVALARKIACHAAYNRLPIS